MRIHELMSVEACIFEGMNNRSRLIRLIGVNIGAE